MYKIFQHEMCLVFNCIVRAKVAQYSISRDMDSHPSSISNGKSMVQGVVGNGDHVMWWCDQFRQVQFTFVFENTLEAEVI